MTEYDAIPLADALKEHLRGTQTAHLTVASSSMEPLLKKGDVIGLQQMELSDIQPGQIVTFIGSNDSHNLLTHRIAAVRQDDQGAVFFLTRGDRILAFDRPLQVENIVGQVIWRIRNGRKLRIDQGSGAWLSSLLGKLAELERRQITGMPLDRVQLAGDITTANEQLKLRRDLPAARFVRTAGRSGSHFLAASILLFARQEAAGSTGTE